MSEPPSPGAFAHQHQDPRGLVERIQAQIRERIEEAVEMAALKLLVDLRARQGRPAPETTSEADRREFEATGAGLLAHLGSAFDAELGAAERGELAQIEDPHGSARERVLAGQVRLARVLPDYWQRLERHQEAYAKSRLEAPAPTTGWLGRLLGRDP